MTQDTGTKQADKGALFHLGELYITDGARKALEIAGQTELEFLRLHFGGDWGMLKEEEIEGNRLLLKKGFRLLSSYRTSLGEVIWIITESDRSKTTLLAPAEF